jgi:RNA polymerase sigma-70 factor (ECF subfamily)
MNTALPSDQSHSRRLSSAPDGAASERQLARWIGEGDEAALAELFETAGPSLYAVAFGITQNQEQAETAVEETFCELWEKRAWLGRLPALSPWLVERIRAWATAVQAGSAPSPAPSLQDRTGDVPLTRRFLHCPPDVRVIRVNRVLEQMPDQEREALLRAARTGHSLEEIGSELHVPPAQVPGLLRRALHQLRQGLETSLRRDTA